MHSLIPVYFCPKLLASKYALVKLSQFNKGGDMENTGLITKVTQDIIRDNGSEVRIVAQLCFGAGLRQSTGVYVLRRESSSHNWQLCNDRPHPEWKTMSVDEYQRRGRSEMLQTVTPGEVLRLTSALGKPMDYFEQQ